MREERRCGSGASGNASARSTVIRNHLFARKSKIKGRYIALYSGIFVLSISLLLYGNYNGDTTAVVDKKTVASAETVSPAAEVATEAISVDKLAAASAVTNLAETTQLPSAGDLREATASLSIKKDLSQNDSEVITKPEIVKPETSAALGITSYVTKEGDTMDKIAARFKISAQTLRWANNTNSDAIEPNKTLVVPMTDGIVYTVKDGDTVQSLAEKYKTDAKRIVLYNDIEEGSSLATGSRIVLPGGELPENERPGYVAPRSATRSYSYGYGSQSSVGSISRNTAAASVGNRYAAGNCTWYAYERRLALGRPIGSFWGNANTWDDSARAAGFVVNNVPAPGAIIQNDWGGGGYGHVGIVERVDGQNIYVSDMNYAGYNVISSRAISIAEAGRYKFIH